MFPELVIVTASACQSGTCPKPAAAPSPAVVVVESPKTATVAIYATERPSYRPLLPNFFQRKATAPVVVVCPGGKCR